MFASTFLKLFPPPKMLLMPYVGLDIADDAIRCIGFNHSFKGLSLGKHHEVRLPVGMIDGGYIHDEAGLIKILSEIRSKLGLSYVRASLPEEKLYLFKAEVAGETSDEIRQSIEFKLEENVPLSPNDAVFYYDLVPNSASGKQVASVSVAPRRVVDKYMSVIDAAGLTLLSFDTQSKALTRAIIDPHSDKSSLIVHIMPKKTGLHVVCGGVVGFSSTAEWGGDMVTSAASEVLGISFEEADRVKRTAGYHDQEDTKKIVSAVVSTIGVLEKEIRRVYAYWLEHGEGCRQVDRIVVSGADALLVGLISQISPSPKVSVEVADVWCNAFSYDKHIPGLTYEQSLDYAVAVGLALPEHKM
jgi:type IV pilus assembly protein PilM